MHIKHYSVWDSFIYYYCLLQMSQYKVSDQFPTQVWPYHKELKPLICAANFAAVKHRKNYLFNASSGIPYINHVICEYFL